jgi:hypothetical protein
MDPEPELQRDILVSIRPFFATKILEGQKSVELRRRFPNPDRGRVGEAGRDAQAEHQSWRAAAAPAARGDLIDVANKTCPYLGSLRHRIGED